MKLAYQVCDVFTEVPLAGNQLGVFPDASGLSPALMQRLARELNYAESTFVVSRSGNRARVRIFTPEVELPFAGHPTLGTAAVLHGGGAAGDVVLELGVGDVPVRVQPTSYGTRCELTAPPAKKVDGLPADAIAAAVGLAPGDLDGQLPCETWSSGNAFAMLAVRSREKVAASRPVVGPTPQGFPLGVVVFTMTAPRNVHARVFCPGASVAEDPATGSANAPLAAYLHARGRLSLSETLVTAQGVEMGRPSRLEARVLKDSDGLFRARVAGGVVRVASGTFDLPEGV